MDASTSKLLSALDSPNIKPPIPLQQTPRRHENTSNAEASSSGSKKDSRMKGLMEARMAQARSTPSSSQPVNDTSFLASALRPTAGSSGFRLNYDDSTPVRSIDVGGADQQQKMAEFVTRTIDNQSHGLTVKSAMDKLGLKSKQDLLPGLDCKLLPHQAIGVSWMVDQEESREKGGILADDMGLGKTVQMIATMVMHMPDADDECKTTLIVVPAALLQQWKDEITEKTNGILTVHIHHGKDKLKKVSQVQELDVVITTYQTLNGDFAIPEDVKTHDEAEWLAENGGVLARTKFYRAIADEAQFIRNRATRSSISLAHVRAKYRWMLTGTPVTNTLADIYGLLRFGRFRPWNDWNDFNEYVAKMQYQDAVEAGKRAQAILMPLILRRTKNSMLEGKPILELPPKEIKIVKFPFSTEEREIYDGFEKQSKITLNRFIREKSVVKHHHYILVLILRLRQLCCHPNLILAQTEDLDDATQLLGGEAEKELSRAIKAKGRPWVDSVKSRYLTRALATEYLDFIDEGDVPDATCPNCKDMFTEGSGRVLGCGHDICHDCVQDLRNADIAHDGEFGNGTEKENLAIERQYEEAAAKGHRPCPTCKKMQDMSDAKIFKAIAFEPSPEDLSKAHRHRREARRKKAKYPEDEDQSDSDVEMADIKPKTFEEKGLDDSDDDLPDVSDMWDERPKKKVKRQVKQDDDGDILDLTMDDISAPLKKPSTSDLRFKKSKTEDFSSSTPKPPGKGKNKRPAESTNPQGIPDALIATWKRGDEDLEPSSKMLKLMDYLKEAEKKGDKTICYSQWTSMLDLIEIFFARHGIRNLRFDGKMDKSSRDATLAEFKRSGGPKIILISTKSGGVGLNLIAANRIVNMDLSWNYASESQAYDRAHRIGQDKPVFVKRLVVENTIEERMLQLQDVKVSLAEAALGEGSGTKLHKLSVKDIKFLFGMGQNSNGNNQPANGNNNQGD